MHMNVRSDISLIVLTPERTLLECKVGRVELPGTKGRFVVLKDHAPVITSLTAGDVVYDSGNGQARIRIRSGFAEVNDNTVTVCAEV